MSIPPFYVRVPGNQPEPTPVRESDADEFLVSLSRQQNPPLSRSSYPGQAAPMHQMPHQPAPSHLQTNSLHTGAVSQLGGSQVGPQPQSQPMTAQIPIQQVSNQGIPPGAVLLEVPTPGKYSVNSGFVTLKPTQEQMQGFNDPTMTNSQMPTSATANLLSFGQSDAQTVRLSLFFAFFSVLPPLFQHPL